MKWFVKFFLLALFMQNLHAESISGIDYLPANGLIKDEKMAADVAKIMLSSVYGKEKIARQLPLKANLVESDIWLVSGSFNYGKNTLGGVAKILIRKKDGAILGMIHEK